MSGLLWYFPNALAEVAKTSRAGNEQHNPGKPLHWDRSKSADHADAAVRHLMQAGTLDTDGVRHLAKAAWRVLALLQEEVERDEGVPPPRNARNTPKLGEVVEHHLAAAYLRDVGERDDDLPTEHNPAAYAAATQQLTDEE